MKSLTMLGLAGVLLLVCFAAGDQVINLNDYVDFALNRHNELLTERHLGLIPVPPLLLPNVTLSHGVAVGLNSLIRTEDCTLVISSDSTTATVDLHFGQTLLAFAYGSIKANGSDFSGVLKVSDNSVRLTYNVTIMPKCGLEIVAYEIERLDKASLDASNSSETIDLSEFFDSTVRSTLNSILSKLQGRIEKGLERLVCNHCGPMTDHLPAVFRTLKEMSLFQE